jgi:hypothetical protein
MGYEARIPQMLEILRDGPLSDSCGVGNVLQPCSIQRIVLRVKKRKEKGLPVPNFAKAAISTSTFLMKGYNMRNLRYLCRSPVWRNHGIGGNERLKFACFALLISGTSFTLSLFLTKRMSRSSTHPSDAARTKSSHFNLIALYANSADPSP